eukprot:Nk52_evm47s1524 gene=Nk52_evmTU47s1524
MSDTIVQEMKTILNSENHHVQAVSTTSGCDERELCGEMERKILIGTEDESEEQYWDEEEEDSDEEDLMDDEFDWESATGDFTKKFNSGIGPNTQNNLRNNIAPSSVSPAGGNFEKSKTCLQPSDKSLSKYVSRINVEKYEGSGNFSSSAAKGLIVLGKKTDSSRIRKTDKSDRATVEQVLDPKTRLILFKMINKGVFYQVNGCISTGKEANVYHAETEDGSVGRAVKIYKTSILVFKDRDRYVSGEFRFRRGYCKSNPRKMVKVWAEKEMRNLLRLQKAGIPCPEPILLKNHVLVMNFIGKKGWPAPRLKDATFDTETAKDLYFQCISAMRRMYHDCRLVHGDLSEYNLLLYKKLIYVIDVSQSVEHDHPNALEFLRKDCLNITDFFRKNGVGTMSVRQLFDFITDLSLENNDVDEYLKKIQVDIVENEKSMTKEEMIEAEVSEQVFMKAFIPRTLEEVPDVERDVFALKESADAKEQNASSAPSATGRFKRYGEEEVVLKSEEIYYRKLAGLTKDLTGTQNKPDILIENTKVSAKTVSEDEDNCNAGKEVIQNDMASVSGSESVETNSTSGAEMQKQESLRGEDKVPSDDEEDETEDDDAEKWVDSEEEEILTPEEIKQRKKEHKLRVKEEKRERRQAKIPKHIKKQKTKSTKKKK